MNERKYPLTIEDLWTLVDCTRGLTTEIGLQPLLRDILSKACRLTDSPDSSVILHNDTRNTLYFAAATGTSAELLLNQWGELCDQQVPIDGSIAGKVFITGKSVVIDRVDLEENHYKRVDGETSKPTQSMVCVPLKLSDKPLGVVQILNKRSGNYDIRDRLLLEHFADHAAVAIRNARLFFELIAHMGLFTSPTGQEEPLALLQALNAPAHAEKMTIMFPDMRGFTQLCQILSNPEAVQIQLSAFLNMLVDEILKERGMINKFLGDGLIAIFRGPDHALRSVRSAFRILKAFEHMKHDWDTRCNEDLEFLDVGIGIATDTVTVGTMGSRMVRDFTVIGNAVNLAAAFEREARNGKRILVDQVTFKSAQDIVCDYEGPENYLLQKPGQRIGHPYKMYHLKAISDSRRIRVFICHSHKDHDFVKGDLAESLASIGIIPWYSEESIPNAASWVQAIREGLKACEWLLVVVSKNAANSKWVCREIDQAIADPRFDGRILPVRLDDTPLGDVNEWLMPLQAIDAFDEQGYIGEIRKTLFHT